MKKHRVLLNFVKLSIPEKVAFCKNVISCLKNNPVFTKPDVELNLLTALTGKYELLVQKGADKLRWHWYLEQSGDEDVAIKGI
ncbi:MAG TPA: hypothetical protein VIH57_21285, partial [Bacteroidales bacterium]